MSVERANPAFTVRVLRALVDEARKRGVDTLNIADIEQAIASIEARRV